MEHVDDYLADVVFRSPENRRNAIMRQFYGDTSPVPASQRFSDTGDVAPDIYAAETVELKYEEMLSSFVPPDLRGFLRALGGMSPHVAVVADLGAYARVYEVGDLSAAEMRVMAAQRYHHHMLAAQHHKQPEPEPEPELVSKADLFLTLYGGVVQSTLDYIASPTKPLSLPRLDDKGGVGGAPEASTKAQWRKQMKGKGR